jgi:hypothetical protein
MDAKCYFEVCLFRSWRILYSISNFEFRISDLELGILTFGRANILFGKQFVEAKYRHCLEICELMPGIHKNLIILILKILFVVCIFMF